MNKNLNSTISIIIPTLNAGTELPTLIKSLQAQSLLADEIIVVDSASTDETVEICREKQVRLIQINRKDFDHGKTRDMALRASVGDIVVFLTQDAVPANEHFLANLISPLAEDGVVASTGRHIPKADASKMEQLVREFNYPATSNIRSKEDLPKMGIKTFFFSDVCSAYNRNMYIELGGFNYPLKTNEDMFFAAKVINHGYRIAYAADALVYHSHNFSLKEQYERNFIQGYEIERHREILNNVSQDSEGFMLVKYVSSELIRHGRILSFIHFGFDCCARLLGSRAGKKAFRKENHQMEREKD